MTDNAKKIGIPVILLIISIIGFVISLLVFFDTASTVSIVIAVIAFGAAVCSAGAVIGGLIARAKGKGKAKGKKIKPFFYFIVTDILLIIAAAIYGVIDINKDSGMMAGLTGYLILWYVVPILAGIGVIAGIIYLITRQTAKDKEHKE